VSGIIAIAEFKIKEKGDKITYRPGYACVKWTLLSFAVIILMLLQRPVSVFPLLFWLSVPIIYSLRSS